MKNRYTLACNLTFGDIAVQLLVWFCLTIITFGIASLFFPYYAMKLILNRTELREVESLQTLRP